MAAAFAPAWFSTEDVAEKDRLPLCRSRLSGLMATLDIEPSPDVPLEMRTLSCELPDACLATCFLNCARACREQKHCLTDGSDHILLLRPVGGPFTVEQNGRRVRVEAGNAVIVSTLRPWTWDVTGLARLDCLRVPRDVVKSAPRDLLAALPLAVSRDVPAFQLLAHYGGALLQGILPLGTIETQRMAAHHVQDLLILLLKTQEQDNTAPATRLDLIKSDIERHLPDSRFSIEDVARRHGVTVRTVQKLFESAGTTFSEYVLKRRLELAWKNLQAPDAADRKISDIAYGAGFGDLSYFNRVFRRTYKMTPRQARAAR